jgi:outer membrane receptor protein involved in Fe transport
VAGARGERVVVRILLLSLLLLAHWIAEAATPAALHTRIPPQSLRTALAAWADQTHLQIVYLSSVVREQQSPGAPPGLNPDAALTHLLEGTGLQFEFLSPQLVRIRPAPAAPAPALAVESGAAADEEVVVTAAALHQISDAALSHVLWTREELDAAQINDVGRLANLTPGVEFDAYQDYGAGIESNISIRGVNARDGSTVAVYVDDTPIPTDRASTFGRAFPLTFDFDHVQILRGPQGVLMGEGAEGGAVRLARAQPSVTAFSALATADYSTTTNGAPSHELGVQLGAPLWHGAGLHVSAWSRHDGGFVDRVDPISLALVEENSNWKQREAYSGAFAWEVSPRVSLVLAMDYQSINVNDTSAFFTVLSNPGEGILRNGKFAGQPYSDYYRLPSLRIIADLGFGRLVSETAFFERGAWALYDASIFTVPAGSNNLVLLPQSKFTVPLDLDQRFISQHIHIESPDQAARLRWMFGAALLHVHYQEIQDVVTEALAEEGGIFGRLTEDLRTTQIAAFGQSDFRLSSRLTVTAGLRIERWSYDSLADVQRPPKNIPVYFAAKDNSMASAPRLSLTYRQDDQRLYYLSAAKGYRMGGYNLPLGAACGTVTPATYGPDTVWSFELGQKGSSFDGRLQDEVTLFHAVWRDIQLQIQDQDCGFGFTSNAGAAASDGIELGVDAALSNHLNFKLTAAYVDARYTQTVYFTDATGRHTVVQSGDAVGALPLVQSPFSASGILSYVVPVNGALVTLRAQDTFHSNNPGPFNTDHPDAYVYAPERRPDPSVNQLDLSVGAQWHSLDISAYVLNALNAQPTLQARDRVPDTVVYATTLRPRVIGISVRWQIQRALAAD